MSFKEYLASIPPEHRVALERVISIVRDSSDESVKEGLSYGLPAFKYKNRPLIGFSSNKHGLNIYPFDPKIIDAIRPELDGFELSKGVVRFTPQKPIPEAVVRMMLDLRKDYLQKTEK